MRCAPPRPLAIFGCGGHGQVVTNMCAGLLSAEFAFRYDALSSVFSLLFGGGDLLLRPTQR